MPRSAVFAIRLSKPSSLPVSLKYRTVDGTATQPSDYTAKSGSITFRPGETMAQVIVPIRDTLPAIGSETFSLEVYDKTNAMIAKAMADCVIPATAADSQPIVTVANITVASGGSAVFTLVLDRAPVVSASINYATLDDTAIAGKDYTKATGTVTFAPGETSKTVSVKTQAASDRELVFYLELLKPVKCTLYQNSPGSATIQINQNVLNLVNAAKFALDIYNASIEAIKVADANLAAANSAYSNSSANLNAANSAYAAAQNDINAAQNAINGAQNTINVGAILGNWGLVIVGQAQMNDANNQKNAAIARANAASASISACQADLAAKTADVAAANTAKANAQSASDQAKASLDGARAAATAAFVGSTTLVMP